MARLTLPAPLLRLLPEEQRLRTRSVALEATSWDEAVAELRHRFPTFARHVLTDDGTLAAGFAVVVNDEVQPRAAAAGLRLGAGDEICVIAALAGG